MDLPKHLEEDSSEEDNEAEEKESPQTPPIASKKNLRQQPTDDTSTSQLTKQPLSNQVSVTKAPGVTKSSAVL